MGEGGGSTERMMLQKLAAVTGMSTSDAATMTITAAKKRGTSPQATKNVDRTWTEMSTCTSHTRLSPPSRAQHAWHRLRFYCTSRALADNRPKRSGKWGASADHEKSGQACMCNVNRAPR